MHKNMVTLLESNNLQRNYAKMSKKIDPMFDTTIHKRWLSDLAETFIDKMAKRILQVYKILLKLVDVWLRYSNFECDI